LEHFKIRKPQVPEISNTLKELSGFIKEPLVILFSFHNFGTMVIYHELDV